MYMARRTAQRPDNTPTRFVPPTTRLVPPSPTTKSTQHDLYLLRRHATSPNTTFTWVAKTPPPLFWTPPKAALANNTTYSDREADGAA